MRFIISFEKLDLMLVRLNFLKLISDKNLL